MGGVQSMDRLAVGCRKGLDWTGLGFVMTNRALYGIIGLLLLAFGAGGYWLGSLDMYSAFESFGCFLEK